MSKAPPKLTPVQSKALEYVRTSLERTGTAPTLRELCVHMGYSAIGSAQDLVSSLRRKGYLHTPDRQSARALVLTPKALALQEPLHHIMENTFVLPCFESLPDDFGPLSSFDSSERSRTLRISVDFFPRPYPNSEKMFVLNAWGDAMTNAGICDGDFLVMLQNESPEPESIVLARYASQLLVRRLRHAPHGWDLHPENVMYPVVPIDEGQILAKVVALQRVFSG